MIRKELGGAKKTSHVICSVSEMVINVVRIQLVKAENLRVCAHVRDHAQTPTCDTIYWSWYFSTYVLNCVCCSKGYSYICVFE
jgi:hypothetical protein